MVNQLQISLYPGGIVMTFHYHHFDGGTNEQFVDLISVKNLFAKWGAISRFFPTFLVIDMTTEI